MNQVTSWIDGSFIYSTSEPWINAMRSFANGAFQTDESGKMPLRNSMRVPLFNNPVPEQMRMSKSETLFCKPSFLIFYYYILFLGNRFLTVINKKNNCRSAVVFCLFFVLTCLTLKYFC